MKTSSTQQCAEMHLRFTRHLNEADIILLKLHAESRVSKYKKRSTITGNGQVAIFQRWLHGVVGFEAETYPGFHAVQSRCNSEKNWGWSGMLLLSSVKPSVFFAVKAPGPRRVPRSCLAAFTLAWLAWPSLTLCVLAARLAWFLRWVLEPQGAGLRPLTVLELVH